MNKDRVFMKPSFGLGEPREVDATPEVLVPLMLAGWTQCELPKRCKEVTENVND